jgi:hypothetical protein
LSVSVRPIDGTGNNPFHPSWGSAGVDLLRLAPAAYADGVSAPAGASRPSARKISVSNFAQITSNVALQIKLKALYGSVNNIDAWVGALAEDHVAGSSTGPLIRRVLVNQFQRLRDGDRFWYSRVFSGATLKDLEETTLAGVIRRDTTLSNVQGNAFFFRAEIGGTVFTDSNRDGRRQSIEPGLANMVVQLLDATTGQVVATTTTNSRGGYEFDVSSGVRLGAYQIRVTLPTGLVQTTPTRTVTLTRGDTFVRNVDLGIANVLLSPTGPG